MGGVGWMGEGVTADAAGNVIAGEVGPVQGLTKFVPRLTRADDAAPNEAPSGGWGMPFAAGLLVMGGVLALSKLFSGSKASAA